MKNFSERLHKSFAKLAPKDMKLKLVAPKNRDISCWIGGSTLSSLKAFNEMWVTKAQYSEHGSNIFRQYL
jgi:actin-related protein